MSARRRDPDLQPIVRTALTPNVRVVVTRGQAERLRLIAPTQAPKRDRIARVELPAMVEGF